MAHKMADEKSEEVVSMLHTACFLSRVPSVALLDSCCAPHLCPCPSCTAHTHLFVVMGAAKSLPVTTISACPPLHPTPPHSVLPLPFPHPQTLKAAFAVFDTSGDGFISAEEMRRIM